MKVISVPKSKFKPQCFKYLRNVEKKNEEICITDYGKPVARIIPYDSDEEILRQLERQLIEYKSPLDSVGTDDWDALK